MNELQLELFITIEELEEEQARYAEWLEKQKELEEREKKDSPGEIIIKM